MTKIIGICIVLGFHAFFSIGQDTFLGEIDFSSSSRPSISATSDGGWYVYAADETRLVKQNECGEITWTRDFDFINDNCCIGDAITVSSNDELTILTREFDGTLYGYRVTQVSASGIVNWSKVYKKNGKDYYPYSIIKDVDENIIIYGIESQVGGGSGFLTIIKMDQLGNLIWSKRLNDGYVWGACIATDDGGVLLRSGDQFMKISSTGSLEWNKQYQSTGTYYYLAPVEVSDGFFFTKNRSGGTGIGFYKINKSGDLLSPNGKFTDFNGNPLPLRRTGEDTFVALFSTPGANGISPVIMEFDKDLNVIRQNGIGVPVNDLFITDFQISSNNSPLITGTSGAFVQNIMFAKLNENFEVGCDFSMPNNFTDMPITVIPRVANIYDLQLDVTDEAVTFTQPVYNVTQLCSFSESRSLNLGKDTLICGGDSLVLKNQSNSNFQNYLWSTGETSSEIPVLTSGTYWVEASNPCISIVYRDTIVVEIYVVPVPENLIRDTILCGDESVLLDATIVNGTYQWQDGSTLPIYLAEGVGQYNVAITSDFCTQRFVSNIGGCEDVNIPNVFTPNGDGINDYFDVEYYGVQPYFIKIYNRWGVGIFESHYPGNSFNGVNSSGETHPDGVYFYIISVGDKKYNGSFTLIN